MKHILWLLASALCLAVPAELDVESNAPEGIGSAVVQIIDNGDTLYTLSATKGARGFFVDLPDGIPQSSTVSVVFEGTEEPLLRGMDIFETEDVGLNIGYPGEHVELTGDFIDAADKEIKNVATPTSSGSAQGNAVSTTYLLGPVKSTSTSYKLFSN